MFKAERTSTVWMGYLAPSDMAINGLMVRLMATLTWEAWMARLA
jgi:hypothetical protein